MHHGEKALERDTVVFFHDNAGNIGIRLDYFEMLFRRVNVNVICVGYRGYGHSKGRPTEAGLQLDANTIVNYIKSSPKVNKDRVFLIGKSLGGAVALHLLASLKEPVFKGVIIESTFTNVSEMVDILFPFLKLFGSFKNMIFKIRWDNVMQVKLVTCPSFFVSGD
jgi:pimeloyl-ACP methyl ester carboxylesterase